VLALASAPAAHADPDDVIAQIQNDDGVYVPGAATLVAADCSGLVSVAQSLAMGQAPHRLGNTSSLLAGRWPGVIPGASPGDEFVIATSPTHMVASIHGVNIEARQSGEHFRVGPAAASPWDRQFTRRYHVDPALLMGSVVPAPDPAPGLAPVPSSPTRPRGAYDPYVLQPPPD